MIPRHLAIFAAIASLVFTSACGGHGSTLMPAISQPAIPQQKAPVSNTGLHPMDVSCASGSDECTSCPTFDLTSCYGVWCDAAGCSGCSDYHDSSGWHTDTSCNLYTNPDPAPTDPIGPHGTPYCQDESGYWVSPTGSDTCSVPTTGGGYMAGDIVPSGTADGL